jgi:hypothetical protein
MSATLPALRGVVVASPAHLVPLRAALTGSPIGAPPGLRAGRKRIATGGSGRPPRDAATLSRLPTFHVKRLPVDRDGRRLAMASPARTVRR